MLNLVTEWNGAEHKTFLKTKKSIYLLKVIRLRNTSLETYPKKRITEIHAYFSIIYRGGTLETI